jgi:nucleoside-diphosphate-sugar epimerase
MVIGTGLLGSAFSDYSNKNVVIFASGVSNSHETNKQSFIRELKLLDNIISNLNNKKLIYFSTVMSGVLDSHYCNHKLYVENYIKDHVENYIIFKLPQVIGPGGNSNNIFNRLKHRAKHDKEIIIYENIKRSLIDIDDIYKIVKYCISKTNKEIINIASIEDQSVLEIVKCIISEIKSNSRIKIIKDHTVLNPVLSNSKIVDLCIKELKIDEYNYTVRKIKKYLW